MTGLNTYSGNTTVGAGTLQILGGQLPAATEYVGYGGTASLVQSGGSNSVPSVLYFGYNPGDSGTYNLSGSGLLSAPAEYIGGSGSGSFTQSGGTHAVSSNLYLNYNSAYMLSGSGLLSASTEYVNGSGGFTQSGGTHTVSSYLYLGYDNGSGTYTLSGNSVLSVPAETIGGTCYGSYWVTTGEHGEGYWAYYAYPGIGNFTQSGGTHSVAGPLYVGSGNGSSGSYNLSGSGFLSAASECIGYIYETNISEATASGSFTQSGGTHAVAGGLCLGDNLGGFYYVANGSYNLSGSGLLSAASETVGCGYNGRGAFTQSGGTNSIAGSLFLGQASGSAGTYNLNGGLLTLSGLVQGGGNAAFNVSAGTFQAGSSFATNVPIVLTTFSGNVTFDTNGNTLTVSGPVEQVQCVVDQRTEDRFRHAGSLQH